MSEYGDNSKKIQKECFTCGKQVYLTKPTPDSQWVKTNMDGTPHVDQKQRGSYGRYSNNTSQDSAQTSLTGAKDTTAITNLEASITKLTTSIDSLIVIIKDYLNSQPNSTSTTASINQLPTEKDEGMMETEF